MNRKKLVSFALLALLGLVLLKATTTAIAAVNFYQAFNASMEMVRSQPLHQVQLEPAIVRLGQSSEQLLGEASMIFPVARLLGSDGCVAANLAETAQALAPLTEDFAGVMAAVPEAVLPENRFDIGAVRQHWDAERAAAGLQTVRQLQLRPLCEGASPRFEYYQDAMVGGLFALEFALSMPWEEVWQNSAHWLVVLNNSDELRATGGFTTALMDIRIDEQGILTWNFLNSYSVDNLEMVDYHPRAPQPMQQFMGLGRWMFRDVNWSPDYPTTARTALQIYSIDQRPAAPNGMVTVNMSAFPTLVRHLPPVTYDGAALDGETVLNLFREAWDQDAPTQNSYVPERKDFIIEIVTHLTQQLAEQLGPTDVAHLGNAFAEMFQRRDIMVYATSPTLQEYFASRRWDGAMIPTTGDYLMVVDSNLGYNKVTPLVERMLRYNVQLGDTVRQARLELEYYNTNTIETECTIWHRYWVKGAETLDPVPTYFDRMTGCFWNYVRVFVPAASDLQAYSAPDLPAEWFAFTEQPYQAQINAWRESVYPGFGLMTVTPTGERNTIRFDYQLPPEVITQSDGSYVYNLTLQKQAGSRDSAIQITITLPPGAVVETTTPALTTLEDGKLRFEGLLTSDQQITVRYRSP